MEPEPLLRGRGRRERGVRGAKLGLTLIQPKRA